MPAHPHLRLVPPLAPDSRVAWLAAADRDARAFLLRHGDALADPSLAGWVIEECAEHAFDAVSRCGGWEQLRVTELWLRLANMHRFFPQPRLVVAYYDTLRAFLPWLTSRGRLSSARGANLLSELEQRGAPMVERAREALRQRQARGG